jgi:uncharacterized protein (TIGR00304 family)
MNPFKIFTGMALLMIGLALLSLNFNLQEVSTGYAGVVLIGPFPLVFASSSDLAIFMLVVAGFMVVLTLLLTKI